MTHPGKFADKSFTVEERPSLTFPVKVYGPQTKDMLLTHSELAELYLALTDYYADNGDN